MHRSYMSGYNELESILVNREDEKYHVQMEGQAPELTPKHRNFRGILTLKTLMKMTSNNKTNRTVGKNMDRIMNYSPSYVSTVCLKHTDMTVGLHPLMV